MRGLDVKRQQKKSSLENGVFESFPSRKIKWSESEREGEGGEGEGEGKGDREREKVRGGGGGGGGEKEGEVRRVKGAPNTMAHNQ